MDEIKIEVKDLTKISDGYHTIQELYDHRNLLFLNLAFSLKDEYNVSYKIDESMLGWIILYIELPVGQISYHVPDKYLDIIKANVLEQKDNHWDGHTSVDVLHRLSAQLKFLQLTEENK